ncbi:hypothetical protein [Cryptosporangium sp. NPDC051539]|uniref:hypothetical protein n=1 Tax=Cryptosporangium sp. NPDC051539 TaxID=3363962 RepID=UPI0037BDD14C
MTAPPHSAGYPACRCDVCFNTYVAPPPVVTAAKVLFAVLAIVVALELVFG